MSIGAFAFAAASIAALQPARAAQMLPGFAIDLFDGGTGTVAVSSREFGEPNAACANGRMRLVWKGHPRLGADFTVTAEGTAEGGATEWTFSCSGNASGLPLGRIAFPVVDVPCADDGYLLYSPDAGGGTMGWKRRILWKGMPVGKAVCSTLSPGFRFVAVLNGESQDSFYLDVRDPSSNAGRFEASSPAASSFSMYSRALKSVSRSFAAVVMRAEMPFD